MDFSVWAAEHERSRNECVTNLTVSRLSIFSALGLDQQAYCFGHRLVLLAVLAFRSTGFEQVGYRFSPDFLPFVFWLLMRSRVQMNNRFKALIVLALVVDVCLTAFFLSSGVARRQAASYGALIQGRANGWAIARGWQ
jgi:hypothetical protein